MRRFLHWLLVLGVLLGSLAGPVQVRVHCCCLAQAVTSEQIAAPPCCELVPATPHEAAPAQLIGIAELVVLLPEEPITLLVPATFSVVCSHATLSPTCWRGPPPGYSPSRAPPHCS